MNNAGIGGGGDALSNPDGWTRVLDVNLFGVLHGVQVFVPAMVASDRPGIVVNTGSKQGITQPPGDTAYNVSKAAVKALTEGLAHTLRQQTEGRVTAHLLIPGFTFTGLTRASEKPPGAWSSEQVVDFMFDGIAAGDFYLLCPDNEPPGRWTRNGLPGLPATPSRIGPLSLAGIPRGRKLSLSICAATEATGEGAATLCCGSSLNELPRRDDIPPRRGIVPSREDDGGGGRRRSFGEG
jgi:NAD(P)-dependent dehydrogenase (short-subunit alcohol dehydrogenase family)